MDKNITKRKFDYFDKNNLILIDGSGYIFRAFYAIPSMTNPDGVPINAVYGFMNMMVKLINDFKSNNFAVFFDFSRKTFRNHIYENYKSNRASPPEELIPQFSIIKQGSKALGLPVIEMDGYEADDLIATFCKKANVESKNVIIISSDKDLMQLVDDNTVMLDPMKNVWIDSEMVCEKFGVKPEQVIDVQSLAGDSSDNVPGVPGIGLKIAAELINKFGSLDKLFLKINEIKQNKRRENLNEFKEQAIISRKLVTLKKDVPIKLKLEELKADIDLQNDKLKKFLTENNFKRLFDRLNRQSSSKNNKEINVNFAERKKDYKLITKLKELDELIGICKTKDILAIDCETDSLNAKSTNLVGISICYDRGKASYIPLRHGKINNNSNLLDFENNFQKNITQIDFEIVIEKLKPIFENQAILKIGHNIKFDSLVLNQRKNGSINLSPLGDTMCISYVLNLGKIENHKLDTLALSELNYNTIKFEEVCGKGVNQKTFDQIDPKDAFNYAAEDADVALELYKKLYSKLFLEKKYAVYEKLEKSLIPVISEIENNGILVNKNTLNQISYQLGIKIKTLENEIFKISKTNFNIGSPKQLGEILFEKMKLGGGKKSKNGSWQTSVNVLKELSFNDHKIANHILNWRHFSKLRSTYSEALVDQINPNTNRIHTSYSMVGTSTGRLSSSEPNLQNIPIRTEEGRLIRKAFESKENHLLLSMDYSQIELRLIAHIASEKSMIEAFNNNLDIHADTASKVFNVPIKDMDSTIRRSAKAINFGIIYGISPFGLAKQLSCTNSEAKYFIDSYFKRFPNIREYMEKIKKELYENGFVETLFGRKININGIDSKNQNLRFFAERQAINAPIQGTAADIMKLAMVKLSNNFINRNSDTKILLQVHDELVFEVHENELENEIDIIKPIMEQANLPMKSLNVNLKVEEGYAKNWSDAH